MTSNRFRLLLLLIPIVFISILSKAQTPGLSKGSASIQGNIIDTLTKKPLEYATISLLNAKTNQVIDGAVTDGQGEFTINNLAAGSYQLQMDFIGYRQKKSNIVQLSKDLKLKLGRFYLIPESLKLNEVEIVSQQDVIEEKVDRLVYNAEKDISAKGGDASDVMKKVPLLSVDLDGNVSLRGSTNVKVLINNKPSSIMAGSVSDALKQIPADMIKSIEVITSPSARYESEGSVGIINIITKKNTLQGLTFGVDASAGNRGAMLGLNGNYRKGNMGFSLRGFGRGEYNIKGAFENIQSTLTQFGIQRSNQSASTLTQRINGSYNLGWDWDISKKANLTTGLRFGTRSGLSTQDNLITQTFAAGSSFPTSSGRDVSSKDINLSYDFNTTYTYTYKPQQELSLLGLYSRNNRTNDFIADLLNNIDWATITARQKNDNISYNSEGTLQAEYQAPLGDQSLIEFGGKGIFRVVNSDYQYYYSEGNNNDFVLDPSRNSNQLNYNQTVAAGFLSYTFSTKNKYSIKAGTRLEHTDITAHFQNSLPGELVHIPSYWNLIPSVNVSKSLNKSLTLKAGYNRRIQRPGIQFLNPNVNEANPTNISVGNPYLDPELTDNFEVSSSINMKNVFLTAALFYRHTGNSITSLRDTFSINNPNPTETKQISAIRTTYQNIGNENTYGLNLFGNVTLFKIWQINGGWNLYNVNLSNNNSVSTYAASNNGWVLGMHLFSNLRLKNGWGLQGGGGARGRQVNLQGYSGSFSFYSIGIRKDLPDGKGNISLSTENFLNHPFKVNSYSKSDLLEQTNINSFYNAGVRIGINYRIGKMSFEEKKRKSVNNDDLKGEGGGGPDNGNGGDQQNQQQGGRGQGQRPGARAGMPGANPTMPGNLKDSTGAPMQSRGIDSLNRNHNQWQGRPTTNEPGQWQGKQDTTGRSTWQGRNKEGNSSQWQGRSKNPDSTSTSNSLPIQTTPMESNKRDSTIPSDSTKNMLIQKNQMPAVIDSIPQKKHDQ